MPKTIKNLQESFDSHSSRKCHLFFETTIWWFPEIVLQCYPQIIHFDWIVHDINQQYVWIPPFMETPIYFAIKIMGVSSQFLHDFMETPIYFASLCFWKSLPSQARLQGSISLLCSLHQGTLHLWIIQGLDHWATTSAANDSWDFMGSKMGDFSWDLMDFERDKTYYFNGF